jgi:IS605 OrfB family transposase
MRQIKPAKLVPGPSGISIKTRLHLSEQDELVLRAVMSHLGSLAGSDLKDGLANKLSWTQRKQRLTAQSSSRYAGTMTRETQNQIRLSQMVQIQDRDNLRAGIRTIKQRLAIPTGTSEKLGKGKTRTGYRDGAERFVKQQRLQILEARLIRVNQDIQAGKLHIVRGGKRLLKNRQHLAAADLTLSQWQEFWWAARNKLSANGSHDELGGNLTIRISQEGLCSILLPQPLRHLSNSQGKNHNRYQLDCLVKFHYREQDWQTHLTNNQAFSYEITYEPTKKRWYLSAGWQLKSELTSGPSETLTGITKLTPTHRSVGLDLNNDHISVWLADESGNPVGAPLDIPLILQGSTSTRDGHICQAIAQVIQFTKKHGATRIYCEDLNFANAKTREKFGHKKQFRNLISSFPTAKFKNRLQSMCARAGIELAVVDPAYTSKNSKSWIKLTSTRARETTGHQAASLAIARRGLALSLSCRKGVTKDKQRIVNRELPTRRRNQAESLLTDNLTGQRRPVQASKSLNASPQPSPLRPILAYLTKPKTIRGLGVDKKELSTLEGTVRRLKRAGVFHRASSRPGGDSASNVSAQSSNSRWAEALRCGRRRSGWSD